MIIFVDYDGVYTEDPVLWDTFIRHALRREHEVHVVTMRYEHEALPDLPCPVHYTGRRAKADFMEALGFPKHSVTWVDDMPWFIYNDAVA